MAFELRPGVGGPPGVCRDIGGQCQVEEDESCLGALQGSKEPGAGKACKREGKEGVWCEIPAEQPSASAQKSS